MGPPHHTRAAPHGTFGAVSYAGLTFSQFRPACPLKRGAKQANSGCVIFCGASAFAFLLRQAPCLLSPFNNHQKCSYIGPEVPGGKLLTIGSVPCDPFPAKAVAGTEKPKGPSVMNELGTQWDHVECVGKRAAFPLCRSGSDGAAAAAAPVANPPRSPAQPESRHEMICLRKRRPKLREGRKQPVGLYQEQRSPRVERAPGMPADPRFVMEILGLLMFSSVTSNAEPVDNFIRFVNGDTPIATIGYSLDGRLFSFRGEHALEPVRFEASFQSNTFYIKPLAVVSSGGVVVDVPTNSEVYGMSCDGLLWMVDDDVKVVTESWTGQPSRLSPVEAQVDRQRDLAGMVLSLGLASSGGLERLIRENANQLVAITAAGDAFPITTVLDSSGRVSTAQYDFSKGDYSATCHVRYRYEDGDRPRWLPRSFERTVKGARNGKALPFTTMTNRIEFCHLGTMDELPGIGYTPEHFLLLDPQDLAPRRTMFYSNGAAFVLGVAIDGTSNLEMVLPELEYNPLHPSQVRMRGRVASIVLLTVGSVGALVIGIFLARSKKQHIHMKGRSE